LVDYHIHSKFSCDSYLEPETVCERLIDLGFTQIAFTEHLDLDPADEGYGFYDYEAITEKVKELNSKYGDKLIIRKGVEVTYQKKREEEIRDFFSNKSYDFITGSIHLVDGFDISRNEGTRKFFERFSREEGFILYFDATYNLVNSGIFNILGHFEMLRRYGLNYTYDYSYEQFKEYIDKILKIVIEKGVVLEVNTSGLRQLPEETYPRLQIVKRFLELGGKYITVGSDSHIPEHLGYRIDETMQKLKKMGVETLTLFKNRKRNGVSLQSIMKRND
jgi:histidinol-phosphatase (PHP family)